MSFRRLRDAGLREKTLHNESVWTRPLDWPLLDVPAPGVQKFQGLVAVFDHASNKTPISLSAEGNYTVDWGDGGATENVSSGVTVTHYYDWSASGLGGITSRGYKTAKVIITPNGGNLTSINLDKKSAISDADNYPTVPWLDIEVQGSYLTSLVMSESPTNKVNWSMLETMGIGENAISDFSLTRAEGAINLVEIRRLDLSSAISPLVFSNYISLTMLPPVLDMPVATTCAGLFYSCFSLSVFPQLITPNVTVFSEMFSDCYNLVEMPLIDTSSGEIFDYMFYDCFQLRKITGLDTSSATSVAGIFSACYNLKDIPLLDTSNVEIFDSMFASCLSLEEVPLLDTSSGTIFSGMFANCKSLLEIPLIDVSNGTDLNGFCNGCSSILEIPNFNFAAATDLTSAFSSCTRLKYIAGTYPAGCVMNNIFSYTNNIVRVTAVFYDSLYINYKLMAAAELDEMYTNLPTVSGKTIFVGGNWGTATDNPSIATAKGWTIAG